MSNIINEKKSINNTLPYEITSSTCHIEIIIGILKTIITSGLKKEIAKKCISYFKNYMKFLSIGPWGFRIESLERIEQIVELESDISFKDYDICTSRINPLYEIDKNIGFNHGPYICQGSVYSVMINKYSNEDKISLTIAVVEKINDENRIKYTFTINPKSHNLGKVHIHNSSGNPEEVINNFYIMPFSMSSDYYKGHENIKEEIQTTYNMYGKTVNFNRIPC